MSVILVTHKDCLDCILTVHILLTLLEPLILREMSGIEIVNEKDGALKKEPFDFLMLHFVVHLVTSASGCYCDCEKAGRDSDFDDGYGSEENMLEDDDNPWLKVGASMVSQKTCFSESK